MKVLQIHCVPGLLSPREPWTSDETVWEAERPGRGLSSGWAAAGSAGVRCKGQVCWGDPGAFGLGATCPACGRRKPGLSRLPGPRGCPGTGMPGRMSRM